MNSRLLKAVLGDGDQQGLPIQSDDLTIATFTSEVLGINTSYPLVSVPRRNPWSGKSEDRLIPLGLRALMEHIAVEFQMYLAAQACEKIDTSAPRQKTCFVGV